MLRFLIASTFAITALLNCQAGFLEFSKSSYSANMYVGVVDNNSGAAGLLAGDIVQTVQSFTYTDFDDVDRIALAITIAEVSATPVSSSSQSYSFVAGTGAGTSSIDTLVAGTWAQGAVSLDPTGATVNGNTFALLTASIQDVASFSASNFDFTNSTNFGLDQSKWSVDMLAGLDGSGDYYEIRHGNLGGASINLADPAGLSGASIFNIAFAQTVSAIYDENSEYVANSGGIATQSFTQMDLSSTTTANLGTTVTTGSTLVFGTTTGAPTGTQYYASNVAVVLPTPGAVPEPGSLAVLGGLTVLGLGRVRRRQAH